MKTMRNRDAWLAAIAAAMGISEEACKRDAAPQAQPVASALASSSPTVAASEPSASASAYVPPWATDSAVASAAPSASASVAAIKPAPTNPLGNIDPLHGICGASVITNGSCGASANPGIGTIGSGTPIGNMRNLSCGAVPQMNTPTTASARAELTLSVAGGAAGDDHVATNLRPRFRACANQALRLNPSEQGRLVVMVKIAANGEVTSADIASNNGISAASAQCMARMVKNAQFAAGATRTLTIGINQTKQSP